jgi:glycosyltransferase involved in cell wall biosynthesis
MNESCPTVAALVPAYNAGKYLSASVGSLLAQTRVPDRIIVIDDASTDGSILHLEDWEKKGLVEVWRNERNLGKAVSLNRAFSTLNADYFLLQDADDIALPHRVERQLAFMEANPSLGCTSGFVQYIGARGNPIARGALDLLSESRLSEYLAGDEPFGLFCPAAMLRREAIEREDLRFRGQFWPADDIDLWNRIAEAGWMVLAQPEVLVQYRIHGSSAVSSNFIRTRLQFEWVRACLRARRTGLTEPGQEEFMAEWNGVSPLRRLNRSRKIAAKGYYRAGGFAAAERHIPSAVAKLFAAVLLDPVYSLKRLASQAAMGK